MLDFNRAIVYDIETFPNCFTFCMEFLHNETNVVWEISQYRDDRKQLIEFFQWCVQNQVPMIGYNNIGFDYPVIHLLWNNPSATYQQLYAKAMEIIQGQGDGNRFGHTVWADNRFAPQVDLFKMHHFDNRSKSTSLKFLQINMRSKFVQDMPIENGTVLTKQQVDDLIVPYNRHDVTETKKFALASKDALGFRAELEEQFGVEVYNWNDTKIGEQTIIQRLGDEVCYDYSSRRKKPRQTPRNRIALKDIIFPYIAFQKPEFQRILDYFRSQTLTSEEIATVGQEEASSTIKTKGVFTDLSVSLNGVKYCYGVGGIHASVERKRIYATDEWLIRDIDVSSLYPSIAIANGLHPEHLGQAFVDVYRMIPEERRQIQKIQGKKCPKANALKLACNGVYGKSNSVFSVFYDPQFTMSITINGQLMLSMLLEKLIDVPTVSIIQANTDGITYYVHKSYEPQCAELRKWWQELTGLILEDANYKSMLIRDVNNYIAVGTDGKCKLKGAYWTPDSKDYIGTIGGAWHKNFSNIVSVRAAVENMLNGTDIAEYLKTEVNKFDFCLAVKTRGSDKLYWGEEQLQKNTRFYVSKTGKYLCKRMPPKGVLGAYKKKNGVSDAEYAHVMQETNGEWDGRVCTANKSKHDIRKTDVCAGQLTTIVNDISDFDWNNVDYSYYVEEARKLLI